MGPPQRRSTLLRLPSRSQGECGLSKRRCSFGPRLPHPDTPFHLLHVESDRGGRRAPRPPPLAGKLSGIARHAPRSGTPRGTRRGPRRDLDAHGHLVRTQVPLTKPPRRELYSLIAQSFSSLTGQTSGLPSKAKLFFSQASSGVWVYRHIGACSEGRSERIELLRAGELFTARLPQLRVERGVLVGGARWL